MYSREEKEEKKSFPLSSRLGIKNVARIILNELLQHYFPKEYSQFGLPIFLQWERLTEDTYRSKEMRAKKIGDTLGDWLVYDCVTVDGRDTLEDILLSWLKMKFVAERVSNQHIAGLHMSELARVLLLDSTQTLVNDMVDSIARERTQKALSTLKTMTRESTHLSSLFPQKPLRGENVDVPSPTITPCKGNI